MEIGSFFSFDEMIHSPILNFANIILLYINLTNFSVTDGIKSIKTYNSSAIPLVCSADEDYHRIFAAFKAGAYGFININVTGTDFLSFLYDAINDEFSLSPQSAFALLLFFKEYPKSTNPSNIVEMNILNKISAGKSLISAANELNINTAELKKLIGNIYRNIHNN